MDYYINRDKLIKRRHGCNRDCSKCDFVEDGDSWCEGELYVIDVLRQPAADVPQKWIPVTERLPEEMDRSCGGWSAEIRPSDDVLVWLSSEKRQSVAWYSHAYNEWTTVDENTVYCFGDITHWMPLPEPPKEET